MPVVPPAVVLVSEGVTDSDALWGRLRVWAEPSRCELVVLPPPSFRARPQAGPAERRRLGRREPAELAALLEGVRGRPLLALFVTQAEVAGQAGRAWRRRLAEAAEQAGVVLPRATRVHRGAVLDLAELEAAIPPPP